MENLKDLGLAYCDTCGNYVPTFEDDGDLFCQYEYFSDYPELATIVG